MYEGLKLKERNKSGVSNQSQGGGEEFFQRQFHKVYFLD